jgi:hypothetical protein
VYLKFFAKFELYLPITPELKELFSLPSFEEMTKIINKRETHIANRPLIRHLFFKRYDRKIRNANSI